MRNQPPLTENESGSPGVTSNLTDLAVNSRNETTTSTASAAPMIQRRAPCPALSAATCGVSAARRKAVGAMVSSAGRSPVSPSSGGFVT